METKANKIWCRAGLVTVEQWHAMQTPAEVYHDCDLRMSGASPADNARLKARWPSLGDCNRAMIEAFAGMTDAERADDLAQVEADLNILALWNK